MGKKYMLVSLDDSKLKSIAEILGNKTSNKIIGFLSEKEEASQKDISDALKIPMNTVEYNLKKMVQSGIIETSKNFFWSQKGKKIKMYRFSNKSIVISPKSKNISSSIRDILPVALISGLAAVGIKAYFDSQSTAMQRVQQEAAAFAADAAAGTSEAINVINTGDYWLWFLAGVAFVIALFLLKIALYEKSWQGWKRSQTL